MCLFLRRATVATLRAYAIQTGLEAKYGLRRVRLFELVGHGNLSAGNVGRTIMVVAHLDIRHRGACGWRFPLSNCPMEAASCS
jgi:hypothetical protein